ncbi:MAG: nickel-dependent hydrogenase large subunit [Burkholderiales bacterium]|nr:hypothetical protein [Ferrovum sp.]
MDIDSTRPQIFHLLEGQAPESAVQMVRMVFNVCGHAQGAAAAAAVAAVRGGVLADQATLERSIAGEAMQEHLWHLLLDWPLQLDLPQAKDDFIRWYSLLRSSATGNADMKTVGDELEARWLGISAKEWLALGSLADLQEWYRDVDSPAVRLLSALDKRDAAAGISPGVALLPSWTAMQIIEEWGSLSDASFAALPNYQGSAAETGMLCDVVQTPMLEDVLRRRPSRLLARVLARVYDALHMIGGGYHGRLDSAQTPDGAGLAVVRTARGLLLHRVRLSAERIKDYLTVAPTEWNFHPNGALTVGLQGMQVVDPEKLMRLCRMQVLSLDPCVETTVEICDA